MVGNEAYVWASFFRLPERSAFVLNNLLTTASAVAAVSVIVNFFPDQPINKINFSTACGAAVEMLLHVRCS
jgi:hypothetical protein